LTKLFSYTAVTVAMALQQRQAKQLPSQPLDDVNGSVAPSEEKGGAGLHNGNHCNADIGSNSQSKH